jgi:hypothetical protein
LRDQFLDLHHQNPPVRRGRLLRDDGGGRLPEYQKGDLLIIDDRASLHKAGFDHSQLRRLYRMLVRGDRPC